MLAEEDGLSLNTEGSRILALGPSHVADHCFIFALEYWLQQLVVP
jgi:hypothetical protein